MRYSKLLIKTYKETPKEAEVISHKLMLRTSMIKQLTRGVYTYLPLALKTMRKIENIVREELNKIGAQEILMPVLQPSDLWQESNRWFQYGSELMRLKDRNNRDFALGPTHEEVVVDIFRNMVTSYKELPLNVYQIQTKFRDEKRPRFGLMRGREFLMKDAYSFHLDEESLNEEYEKVKQAYCNIFTRCGLNFRAVEADTGSIGGTGSHEFMVLAQSGEDDIVFSNSTDYAANIEKAVSDLEIIKDNSEEKEKELVLTENMKTMDDLSEFLNIDKSKMLKCVLYKETLEDNTKNFYIAAIRGDLEINEIKLKNHLNTSVELELLNSEEVESLDILVGYLSPLKELSCIKDKKIKVIIDESVQYMKNFIAGANIENYHYINLNLKDIHYDFVNDIRMVRQGDLLKDGSVAEIKKGIEVGHIFKLGDKYSKLMNASVLNSQGKSSIVLMGCYGIGISRVMAATIEQYHDENGIIWPKAIAPYLVNLILLNAKDENLKEISEKIYKEMLDANIDVIYDDRNEKVGVKFKDSDLIGIPLRIVVGKSALDGKVELKFRNSSESFEIEIDKLINYIKDYENKLD